MLRGKKKQVQGEERQETRVIKLEHIMNKVTLKWKNSVTGERE